MEKTIFMKSNAHYFSWCIAYIDSTHLDKVNKELAKYKQYAEVEAYIPTVKILKKTFKGKNTFEEVPLLFNYGFFKIPRKFAIHSKYLEDMKGHISAIYEWVKDPHKIKKSVSGLKLGERDFYSENDISAATADPKEVAELMKKSFDYSAHSKTDIAQLHPGQMITLHGYPFDEVTVTVVEINPKKETVKVRLNIFDQMRDVDVSYDNVFFTIYHGRSYDDTVTVKNSLNAMVEFGSLDKKTAKDYRDGEIK